MHHYSNCTQNFGETALDANYKCVFTLHRLSVLIRDDILTPFPLARWKRFHVHKLSKTSDVELELGFSSSRFGDLKTLKTSIFLFFSEILFPFYFLRF